MSQSSGSVNWSVISDVNSLSLSVGYWRGALGLRYSVQVAEICAFCFRVWDINPALKLFRGDLQEWLYTGS